LAKLDREIITRQIRDAVDIVDVIGTYVTLRRAGSGFKGLCPFHEEKTPSFNVDPLRQIFKCFGCGAGGDVFTFIQMREKVDFLEARRILAEQAGISLENEVSRSAGGPAKSDLARVNQWAQRIFLRQYKSSDGQSARDYVASRQISEESAEGFGLGFAVNSFDSLIRQASVAKIEIKLLIAAGLVKEKAAGGYYDTFRNRLMFPILDVHERIVGFGGRTLGDDPAKYMNTPATALFDKGTHLFGLNRARKVAQETGRIIVVEGYTDCIMAHQFGFTDTVATLGTALTDSHAGILRRYTDKVILLFDSDQAGQMAADRALSVTLTSGLDVTLARVPEGKDPCDYLLSAGKTGFDSTLKAGIGALEFKWQQVAQAYNASATGPGRRRAIEAYLEQLSQWVGRGAVDPILKGLLLNQLSKVLSIPAEELHRQLQRMTRRTTTRAARTDGQKFMNAALPAGNGGQKKSSEQVALQQIVEVLLNKPEIYSTVEDYFNPSAIADPALAAVAGELVTTCRSNQAFRLDEFIGRFASADYGRLITDLQVRGQRRGAFEAVIEGAISCLETVKHARHAVRMAEEIRQGCSRQGPEAQEAESQEDQRLRDLTSKMKLSHFSTAKARKKYLS